MNRKRKNKEAYKAKRAAHLAKKRRAKVICQVEGIVQMTREGFVFVTPSSPASSIQEDIFVKSHKTHGALNGDRVMVDVTAVRKTSAASAKAGQPGRQERCEGVITEILERSKKPFVGFLHIMGREAWVLMQSKFMPYDIAVREIPEGAKQGYKVAVVVDEWPRGESNPIGHIVDVLGLPGENDTEMHAILAEYGLPYRFEEEVEKAADAIPAKITKKELSSRKDFRNSFTFTIDPSDAKDFDDAISFTALKDGNFEIGVHIADVSHYVTPGSIIDKEARSRGTSVYLADRTVPMLPEKLCNNLCSLRPGEDKLCFSAVFTMTPKAEVIHKWFGRTVINSDARLDYGQAQSILFPSETAAPGSTECSDRLCEAVRDCWAIARQLRHKRFKEGAVNFERPEMKVVCDEKGHPVEIVRKDSVEANWLIEEFMLLANRSVAQYVATMAGTPTFVYRIHDEPNQEKLDGLRTFVKNFGYKLEKDLSAGKVAGALGELFEKAKDTPEENAITLMALRCMAKAVYSVDNIGHYGLAFKYYTHFTSPIRRYPDLMVHRLLAQYLSGGKSADEAYYQSQCKHASEREQLAADAERASIKYKMVEYMIDKVGFTFNGTVSGITQWGMYVEIEPSHVEGMIALRDIRSDFYEFDEERYILRPRHRKGRTYTMGSAVRIRVSRADLDSKQIDFELIED